MTVRLDPATCEQGPHTPLLRHKQSPTLDTHMQRVRLDIPSCQVRHTLNGVG